MSARRFALLLGGTVLAISGFYVFVYLYRWEWNRAMFCLGLFVAVEVAMGLGMVMGRLGRLHRQIDDMEQERRRQRDPRVLARIADTAPEPSRPFAWLTHDDTTTNVFVPILMGAGIVLSALAWLVERVASATARPAMEQDLAGRLSALALPDGLVPPRSGPSLYHPRP
jgi:hypothetical protein